jgi:ABC-type antimicrobial peptide transport system permease subunit
MLLTSIGVFGVVAAGFEARRREIGLRLALGAARRHVFRLTVGRTLVLVVVGLVTGVLLAAVATRLLREFLFGVSPTDALTLAIAGGMLACLSLMAAYLPARRALQLDPIASLRHE